MIPSVEVWTDLESLDQTDVLQAHSDVLVGIVRFSLRRGALSSTFQYDPKYLSNPRAYAIQPDIPLSASPYHFMGLPGALRDSAPDRWGRRIVLRELAEQAASQGISPRSLDDADFFLGVSDQVRQGALRFKKPNGAAFLSPANSVPPLIQLPQLLRASHNVMNESAHEELKELLDAGSNSLGGARPKAAVMDNGKLFIAKFPHESDEWDVMAWEKTMLDLAHLARIDVPACRLVRIGRESCLLTERFDRAGASRIAYLSAMSLVGLDDGNQGDYAEVGEAMEELVGDVSRQLEALFRRVVFSIGVHNTDDHLRNHGFLRRSSRWGLSPLFDVNPNPSLSRSRATAVYGETGDAETKGACDLAYAFGISMVRAQAVVKDVLAAVSKWQQTARRNGCQENELALFNAMFADRTRALAEAFKM